MTVERQEDRRCYRCDWYGDHRSCGNRTKLGEPEDIKSEDYHHALIYSYDEGGCLSPGPRFGCIHWKPIEQEDGPHNAMDSRES